MNYYNDNERTSAAWLRELIAAGLIPDGHVDERSIADVQPRDIIGYTQCHFFAGIGGWPYALRLAGWPEDRPVWTGSCPCQPFSCAGKQRGTADERHLWPEFARLIAECRPPVCFGEQVASAAGREWLDGVRLDLEDLGYAVGAADLCAASVGAPHIRQRLFWVAHTTSARCEETGQWADSGEQRSGERLPCDGRREGRLAESEHAERREERCGSGRDGQDGGRPEAHGEPGARGEVLRLADAANRDGGTGERREETGIGSGGQRRRGSAIGGDAFWSASRWHECIDGKARRVPLEPALFPLAHGLPGRVGLLRGAGNAIVPKVAAEFVRAFMRA